LPLARRILSIPVDGPKQRCHAVLAALAPLRALIVMPACLTGVWGRRLEDLGVSGYGKAHLLVGHFLRAIHV